MTLKKTYPLKAPKNGVGAGRKIHIEICYADIDFMAETFIIFRMKTPLFHIDSANPLIIIVSGISGAGKDSVIAQLKEKSLIPFHFVVTCNTRAKRTGEKDGSDYHFISREKFLAMVEQGEMIEHSPVYDDFKGVPKFEIEKAQKKGMDMILRLDFQGAQKVKKVYPEAVMIFIVPPNSNIWRSRLENRGSESAESLQLRIETAEKEIAYAKEFDYIVVNDDLDHAVNEFLSIIQAEHIRSSRRKIVFSWDEKGSDE